MSNTTKVIEGKCINVNRHTTCQWFGLIIFPAQLQNNNNNNNNDNNNPNDFIIPRQYSLGECGFSLVQSRSRGGGAISSCRMIILP